MSDLRRADLSRRRHGSGAQWAAAVFAAVNASAMTGQDRRTNHFGDLLGFPPRKHFVVLPRWPVRAALGGLALYDATYLHQRFALTVGRILLRLRLGGLLRLHYEPPLPGLEWWQAWVRQIAEPVLGPVSSAAFRLRGDRSREPTRVSALLFDQDGRSLGFVKLWRPPAADDPGWGKFPHWRNMITILRTLGSELADTFRVPQLLAEGSYGNRSYIIQRSLPQGAQQGLPHDPPRLYAIVDELQARLAFLERPRDVPDYYVPIHGDVTPVNVRIAPDGWLWLLDWDKAGWGPPLADELRYWLADFGRRPGLVHRKASRVAALLHHRGTESQILEALAWRECVRPREGEQAEQAMRDALNRLLRATPLSIFRRGHA